MIGSKALKKSLLEYGLKIVKEDPDYVVMGESREYRYEDITNAINFVNKGARFIATNDDVVDIDEVIKFKYLKLNFETGRTFSTVHGKFCKDSRSSDRSKSLLSWKTK